MTPAPQKRVSTGLGFRLALMVILALLPLGVLSLGQTRNLVEQSDEGHILAAMGETVQTALPEVLTIGEARTLARSLARVLGQSGADPALCRQWATAAGDAMPEVSQVAFVPPDGVARCASAAVGQNFAASADFPALAAARVPQMQVAATGILPGATVLLLTHPVIDPAGAYLGFVAVSIPHRALTLDRPGGAMGGAEALLALTTFDAGGEVLSSTAAEGTAGTLPRDRTLAALAAAGKHSFFGQSEDGERRLYTVVPIADGLFLLGTWRVGGNLGLLDRAGLPYLFPLLMWLAGLGVALFGAERLVLRHLRRLSRAMRGFAFGGRGGAPELVLQDPPAEIASLADTYRTLVDTILRDEAELENLLRQKAELLREVHHRTGNSLQLIASILRMHRRETEDPAMLQLIDALHDRVMSLSTVHLGLYRIAGRADVAMDALLAEVIAKVGAIQGRSGARGPRRDTIRAEMVPMMLTAQQAVPLAMLVGEMLAAFPRDPAGPGVTLKLTRDADNMAQLTLTGPVEAMATLGGTGAEAPSVIATRLIRSFVTQLEGEMELEKTGPLVEARVRFLVRLAAPEPAQAEVTE